LMDKLRAVIDKSTEARAVGVELGERKGRREVMTLLAAGTGGNSSPVRWDGRSVSVVGRDEANMDEGEEGDEDMKMDVDAITPFGSPSHRGTAAKSSEREKPKPPRPKAWKSAGIHLHVRPDLGEDKASLERLEALLRRVQSSG
jgi:hypothetical protein